jgi:alpha-tubulin suppressor-like RCC1 family protein
LYKSYRNIWVFGKNNLRQLGLGDNIDQNFPIEIPNFKAQQVAVGNVHTVIIDLKNNMWVFGNNEYGQLGSRQNNTNTDTQLEGKTSCCWRVSYSSDRYGE